MSDISVRAGSCWLSDNGDESSGLQMCWRGVEVPLRLDASHRGPTGMYHSLFIWRVPRVFFRKITCRSSAGLMLGLFGTATPPKFILSHISFIPRLQPLCTSVFAHWYHWNLVPRWVFSQPGGTLVVYLSRYLLYVYSLQALKCHGFEFQWGAFGFWGDFRDNATWVSAVKSREK